MFVIPMAGRSQRFLDAGYDKPKYMLPLKGGVVFDASVGSFSHYFATEPFLFIARASDNAEAFIHERARALGIATFDVVVLPKTTAGQAETVELGLRATRLASEAIAIFNIDTFRPGYRLPPADRLSGLAGYLEVFEGEGPNWSYVLPAGKGERLVAETAEKRPISNLCCTGLYYFRSQDFLWALEAERAMPQASELYIAPIYNHLIRRGERVGYEMIGRDEVIFCGTPLEYEELLKADPL